MSAKVRLGLLSLVVAALAAGAAPAAAVPAGSAPAGSVALTSPAAVPTAAREVVRPIARCSRWRFVPPATTTCLAPVVGSLRVRTEGATYLAWSATAKRWVPIAYRWNPATRRLELDARRLSTPQPAVGRSHSLWQYRCSAWSMSSTGVTSCRTGRAVRVMARFDAPGGRARLLSAGRYVSTAYRWATAGGFLSLDARLLPSAATVDFGPSVTPAYAPGVIDYAARCTTTGSVPVAVTTAGSAKVSVDGAGPRIGSFGVSVPLAAGQSFTVEVQGAGPVRRHVVRCLPQQFPQLTVQGALPASDAMIALSVGPPGGPGDHFAVVTDHRGTPVWWKATDGFATDVKPWVEGRIAWGLGTDYVISTLDGTVERTLGALDQHDLLPLANGNVLAIKYVRRTCPAVPADPPAAEDCVDLSAWGGPARAEVTDGEIVEIAPNGTEVWRWRSRDHIALGEAQRWLSSGEAYLFATWDLVHLNSLEVDGDGIVFSARHLDAVYRIDRATGEITWKLGGTTTPQSLEAPGLDFGGQHDARLLDNGDLTVFDNRTDLVGPPRSVRLQIDPVDMTAQVLEQVTDPQQPTSFCCGGTRRMPDGTWVTAWGGTPQVAAYAPGGARVFSLRLPGTDFTYRAVPVTPGGWTLASLRAGMDAMHPRS